MNQHILSSQQTCFKGMDGWMDGYICIELSLSKDYSKPRFYPPTMTTSRVKPLDLKENILSRRIFLNSLKCIYFGPFAYQQ